MSDYRNETYDMPEKPRKKNQNGGMALMMACCVLFSGAAGFGGGYLASQMHAEEPAAVISSQPSQTTAEYTPLSTTDSGMSIAQVAEKTADSVVEISTETVQMSSYWLQQYVTSGAGSGVILSEDGYIATNNHVIEGASKITVRLHDGEEYEASLIGPDEKTDIALLKVEAAGLSAAVLGDSDKLTVGEDAIAVGNPLGSLGGTVTNGIISALDREINLDGETMNLLQTNAAINPGNSGGGLFNGKGELIGLVVAKSSGENVEGLGFAIPVNDVKVITQQLKENGYVTGRPLLGVSLIDITTMQDMMRYQVRQGGVYIYQITGEAAANAGLMAGDCIVSVDGREIKSSRDIGEIVEQSAVGDVLHMTIIRSTQTMEITVTMGEDKPSSFQTVQDRTESM